MQKKIWFFLLLVFCLPAWSSQRKCQHLGYVIAYKAWHRDQLKHFYQDAKKADNVEKIFQSLETQYLRPMQKRIQAMSDRELYALVENWSQEQFARVGYLPGHGNANYAGTNARADFPKNMDEFWIQSIESMNPDNKQSIFMDVLGNSLGNTIDKIQKAWEPLSKNEIASATKILFKNESDITINLALEEFKVRLKEFRWTYFPNGNGLKSYQELKQRSATGAITKNGFGIGNPMWSKTMGADFVLRNLKSMVSVDPLNPLR